MYNASNNLPAKGDFCNLYGKETTKRKVPLSKLRGITRVVPGYTAGPWYSAHSHQQWCFRIQKAYVSIHLVLKYKCVFLTPQGRITRERQDRDEGDLINCGYLGSQKPWQGQRLAAAGVLRLSTYTRRC